MKPAQLKSLLTKLENAAIENSWRGAAHPDYWDAIQDEYVRIRKMVEDKLIAEICQGK